jgi:hypothetical protein
MADVSVTCIKKNPRSSAHDGITHLGGAGWNWTRQLVIVSIEAGTNSFYIDIDGKRSVLKVVNEEHGKYLRAQSDGEWNDDLLAMPDCAANKS